MSGRFWLRPKWIFGHLLCLTLVITFVNLGFWQLRRLDERRDRNAVIEVRQRLAPTSLANALGNGAVPAVYRRARVTGQWLPETTVLVRSRALDQQAGYDILTTLQTGDGAVVVDRGFVPHGTGGEPAILRTVRPAPTRVTITGMLRASEERGGIGPKDPATGQLDVVNRIDLGRLEAQSPVPLAPVYLQARSIVPDDVDVLRPIPLPTTDDGPHLSYAGQWFIFATVGAVGWPLLLRRTGRDERQGRS